MGREQGQRLPAVLVGRCRGLASYSPRGGKACSCAVQYGSHTIYVYIELR